MYLSKEGFTFALIPNPYDMRLKITLKKTSRENELPASYQYELSAWIYKIIAQADAQYGDFLHNQGHTLPQSPKTFKLFSFSNLFIFPFQIDKGRIWLQSKTVHFFVSFYVDKTAETFILGLFKDQHFRLGDAVSQVSFRVENVEIIALPTLAEVMTYQFLSPVVVARDNAGEQASYLPPTDSDFPVLLKQNLLDKYLSVHSSLPAEWQHAPFEVLPIQPENAKPKLITLKARTTAETKVKGYQRFQLQMTAPRELHELALLAGLVQKNAQGFGFVEAR
ncbi:MAG: CRISPR-associated endoribonuclease Cas6 [Bacteroidetes bacterium]|nr:MAG: CRISPR-associated endoribonuclease Cas6 [Bacteroidota bacterium]